MRAVFFVVKTHYLSIFSRYNPDITPTKSRQSPDWSILLNLSYKETIKVKKVSIFLAYVNYL